MSIIVKDGNSADKYYQTIEDGSLANPFQSVVPNYSVAQAIRDIEAQYSDTVSIWDKAKSLLKYGGNPDLDVAVSETIWNTGGNETLKTANDIDIVVSTDAGDTQEIVIEGHTISGNDLTFVTQTLTLNGTTNVSLTTPLARVNRLYNNDSTDFAGVITVEDNGTSVNLTVDGTKNENQSRKCQTAISQFDYYIITQMSGGIVGNISANVAFKFQIAPVGGVWRTVREFNSNIYTEIPVVPHIIVPPNHDVRMLGTSDTNNTEAVGEFAGYLASIQ